MTLINCNFSISTSFVLKKQSIFILNSFPQYESILIFLTILLLAETHFGATWPFFLNKVNSSYIKDKKIEFIYIPIFISIISLISFILIKNTFLLLLS